MHPGRGRGRRGFGGRGLVLLGAPPGPSPGSGRRSARHLLGAATGRGGAGAPPAASPAGRLAPSPPPGRAIAAAADRPPRGGSQPFGVPGLVLVHRELEPDQPLDVAEELALRLVAEADRHPAPARARRPTDPVHVALGLVRQVGVEDVADALAVQTPGRDVRRDQDREVAGPERLERPGPGGLALVAVDRGGRDAIAQQLLHQPVRPVLRPREDDGALHIVLLDEPREQRLLVGAVAEHDALLDLLHRRRLRRDLDPHGVGEEAPGELHDALGHRGREQQVLALARQEPKHPSHVVDEAHVEHAVGLVEHEELDVAEVDVALPDQVQQPPGGGDQHVHPALQHPHLRPLLHPAEDHGVVDLEVAAVGVHALTDLGRQLPGGREHEGPDRPTSLAGGRPRGHVLQDRERERGGLSGSGLRAAQHVPPLQEGGNGLALDGGRGGVALRVNGAQEGLDEVERREGRQGASGERCGRRVGPGDACG